MNTEDITAEPIRTLPPKPNKSPTVPPDESSSAIPKHPTNIILPIPIPAMATLVLSNIDKTVDVLSTQEQCIVSSCTDILENYLPRLTLDVLDSYNKKMDFMLAEAQLLALYNNAKHLEPQDLTRKNRKAKDTLFHLKEKAHIKIQIQMAKAMVSGSKTKSCPSSNNIILTVSSADLYCYPYIYIYSMYACIKVRQDFTT